MTPLITVPLPTVPGREELLARAIAAYEAHANVEIIVVENSPTCGYAWTYGAERATGDYIHFGADDVEMHAGWAEAAVEWCDNGKHPAPLVFNTDGTVQSCGGSWGKKEPDDTLTEFSRGPFLKTEWWRFVGPVPADLHYWTDNWVSWRCEQHGIPTFTCHGYAYTHHMAKPGRVEHRMGEDAQRFQEYKSGLREVAWPES